MRPLKKKRSEWLGILGTILVSFLLFLFISRGNLNFGLFDDNQAQWLPVIDGAYETFMETGKLPFIDFFQMKGMKIYDQGYYGLWNPFMFASWLLKTYLLAFSGTNTISVYIVMMIVLGNLCCYGIFRRYKISVPGAVLLSSCLMSTSVYVALSYWYYIYNVYFILSWIILRLLKQEEKKDYYAYGAILSFSLLMGNVQYTVYMFVAFVLIMCVLFFRGDQKAIGKIISNGICMGILSAAPLLLLMQASARTLNFSGNNAEYYSSAVHVLTMVLFSWIPSSFLGDIAEKAEGFFYANVPLPDTGFFPGAGSMYMGVMVCAAVVFLLCRKKYKKEWLFEIANAGLVSAGLLLLLSFGRVGLLAVFVRQIPFMGSFRIMAKYLVLLPVLLVPCVAVVVKEQNFFWNRYTVLFLVFMLLGVIHNRQIAFGTPQIQTDKGTVRLEELGADYHNYRILGFASMQEIQVCYPQWEDFSRRERISYEEKFSKNAGTKAGVLTLGGYDLAFDLNQYLTSDSMMGTMSGYASEFGYDNMVIEENFIEKYRKENSDYEISLKRLHRQILDNSVKYYIFTKNSPGYYVFKELLADLHMRVEWEENFLEHTIILSIADIPSLVRQEDGENVNAEITMGRISFFCNGSRQFQVGMQYDTGLRACYTGQDRQKLPLSVQSDERGYIIVSGLPETGYGVVEIEYSNLFYVLGEIWNATALVLIMIMLWAPENGIVKHFVCHIKSKMVIFGKYLAKVSLHKRMKFIFAVLLCVYVGFMGVIYLHTGCTVPDEDWFLQMFRTIRYNAEGNFFAYFGETENYLGYGQIYWILGAICPRILPVRIAAYAMLMGSFFLTLQEIKYSYGKEMLPYAGILWILMPYAWFDGKKIGPEILGLFLGILGLYILRRKKDSWTGWVLLGISGAVKMNYMIFLLAAFCEKMWDSRDGRAAAAMKAAVGSGIGFFIANPIISWDLQTFLENMALKEKTIPEALSYVFERREYEWDGVMVNGVFWGYISAFLLFAVFVVWMVQRLYRRKDLLSEGSNFRGNAAGAISLLLILICCREVFLGWYLLPLCYFGVLFACGVFYCCERRTGTGNLSYWIFAVCLLANGLILLPEHISHRENNMAYMRMQADRGEIEEEVADVKNTIGQQRPNANWYYLLDFHMGDFSYNFKDYADFCVTGVEGIAVIGERMRCVAGINEIVEEAIAGEGNLQVLWKKGDVWILERENGIH